MSIYLDGMFYRSTGVGRVYENLLTSVTIRMEDASAAKRAMSEPASM